MCTSLSLSIYIYIYTYIDMYISAQTPADVALRLMWYSGRVLCIFFLREVDLRPISLLTLGFREFDSSIILIWRGGILMSIGGFPESLSRAMLEGCNVSREIGRTPLPAEDFGRLIRSAVCQCTKISCLHKLSTTMAGALSVNNHWFFEHSKHFLWAMNNFYTQASRSGFVQLIRASRICRLRIRAMISERYLRLQWNLDIYSIEVRIWEQTKVRDDNRLKSSENTRSDNLIINVWTPTIGEVRI